MRQAFIHALQAQPGVVETKTEFKLSLQDFPHVGGVELSVRLEDRGSWTYFLEFKWDSLYMALWDAFKMLRRLTGEWIHLDEYGWPKRA